MADLTDLATKVEALRVEYERAVQEERFALIRSTDALIRLNTAQGDLDEAYKDLLKAAPRGSDWARRREKE